MCSNGHRVALAFLLLALLSSSAFSDTAEANRLRDQAQTHLRNKNVTEAVACAEKAIQEDSENGFFDFYAAYLYLYQTTDRRRALDLLHDAERKGYVNGLPYHRMGMCAFHLGEHEDAVAYLERSIDYNKERLLEAENAGSSSRADSLKREIADSYVWLTKQYEALYEPSEFLQAVEEGLEYNPSDQWLPGLTAKRSFLRHTRRSRRGSTTSRWSGTAAPRRWG